MLYDIVMFVLYAMCQVPDVYTRCPLTWSTQSVHTYVIPPTFIFEAP